MTEYMTSQFMIALAVTIRPALKTDLRKLEWHGEFKHFRRLFHRSYQDQLNGNRLMLIAESNQQPIGRLFIQFGASRSGLADGQHKAYLYSFHIMPAFRGYGIGTHLLDEAETILRQKGFRQATIGVSKENDGALRLYLRRQYQIADENEGKWQYYDHRGRLVQIHDPCWLLEKQL